MDILAPVKAFDSFQQRHTALAIPFAVVKKFSDDSAGNLAALFAYYAFFSIFPILLVFVTILGYVLQDRPGTIDSIERSVSKNYPALERVVNFESLHGHWYVLIAGLLTSLWSGLGVTSAAQNALDTIWAVPRKRRPNFIQSKLRGVGLLFAIGILFVIATAASGLVSGGLGGDAAEVGGVAVSLLANVLLFVVSFRLLTSPTIPTRRLLIGAGVAAIFWTILQAAGGVYVGRVTSHMSSAYATVGTVLVVLIWLHLGAQLTLYAAEINTVLERHLYPRSLLGPPDAPADQQTLHALAKMEERHDEERIEVAFDPPPPDPV